MPPARKLVVKVVVGTSALALGLVYWSVFTQIGNCVSVQTAAKQIALHRLIHGSYPESITAKDKWGQDLLYITNGRGFVVVSFGLGGRPDRDDYAEMIGQRAQRRSSNCEWPWTDSVFTDDGAVICCSK